GNDGGKHAVAGDELQAFILVVLKCRAGWRRSLAAKHLRLAGARRVEDDRHFAGGTDQMRLDNLQHEGGRDGGVERVAALFQNGHARSGGKPVGCRDDTKRAEDLGPCRNHLQTPFNQLSRGSSASRKPSPRRLKPSTPAKVAPPGESDIHGPCVSKVW